MSRNADFSETIKIHSPMLGLDLQEGITVIVTELLIIFILRCVVDNTSLAYPFVLLLNIVFD